MNVIRPLICVLSPRDISIVKQGHDTFKHVPHLWLKYMRAIDAYAILTDFFLYKPLGKQFTHLVISPDDLVVKREHYEALVSTLEEKDYPVFSGVCNVDIVHPKMLAICKDVLPHVIRKLRRYVWVNIREDTVLEDIMRVKFAGMPFLFMRRDIVEQIPLDGDTKYDPNPLVRAREPQSFDCAFCWECNQRNIPIYVDTRVRMLHLRGGTGSDIENFYIGKKQPLVYYQVNNYIKNVTPRDYRFTKV